MESTLSVKQTLSKPQNTKLVLTLLGAEPAPTRNGLAKELCRQLDLRDSKGDWQMATTSKALREPAIPTDETDSGLEWTSPDAP